MWAAGVALLLLAPVLLARERAGVAVQPPAGITPAADTTAKPDSTRADSTGAPADSSLTTVEKLEATTREAVLDGIAWTWENLLTAWDYGARTVETERIVRYADFFDTKKRPLGAYPVLLGTSRLRVKGGGMVYFNRPRVNGSLYGDYAEEDKWKLKAAIALRDTAAGRNVRQIVVSYRRQRDDDMRFFGIGDRPGEDPRSRFLPDADHDQALFYHELERFQGVAGVRLSDALVVRFTLLYQRRGIIAAEGERDALAKVFDVAQLPGGRGSRAHIYNEFAVRHEQGTLEEPGGDLEVYGGFAAARDPRQASFVRAGFDASFHLPVISPGHLAAVRLVANMAEEVTPGAEKLAFYDYPRHPTFRGISTRYLLRSDRLVLVPSLNFHRQLSDRFTVRLFTDGLAVAPALADLRPANGLWAVGTEIVYHNDYADLAGLLFAYGPEGVRLSMFLGSSSTRNERTHWR